MSSENEWCQWDRNANTNSTGVRVVDGRIGVSQANVINETVDLYIWCRVELKAIFMEA